jgi:hypothetical protein
MDSNETGNRKFETLAWGLLFIWLGAWWGFLEGKALPGGAGALGVGLILVGLNLARWLKGLPVSILPSAFGALFLILGGMKLANVSLNCSCLQMPVYALFLIILGGILLVREFLPVRKTTI